jgi:hypothetical protein
MLQGTGGSELDLTDARDTPLVLIDSSNTANEYCLTVETAGNGGYSDALKLVMPCSYSAAQQFKYDADGRLVHIATGKCLTYPSDADAVIDTTIALAVCVATAPYPHQIWRVDDKKALRPKRYLWAGLCLKVGTKAGAVAASCEYASGVNTWTVGAQAQPSASPASFPAKLPSNTLRCAARSGVHMPLPPC